VWQELLHIKYLQKKTLLQVTAKPIDSPFLKGNMGVKEAFFSRGSFVVGDGKSTRFWEDTWLGDNPLANQYPSLFKIVRCKNIMVANVLGMVPLNIEFRRTLTRNKWNRWFSPKVDARNLIA
jgi:hypothetical protein